MPGSKRGEKRGGAKGKRHWTPNPDLHKEGVRGNRKGAKDKPKVVIGQEVVRILNSRAEVSSKEQQLERYFVVTGKRLRMPKEVMLSAMAFFEEAAVEDVEIMQANLELAGSVESEEEKEPFLIAAAVAEDRVRANLTSAVDIAYKVAPYVHPRLSAIMTNPGSENSPLNILGVLLRDLDEAGRPARYIDHDSSISVDPPAMNVPDQG